MKAAVEEGVEGIRDAYGESAVRVVPDGQGGAWVEIADVELGPSYQQSTSFLVCQLPFTLPGADVYPMFVRSDLVRTDGQALGEGFQVTQLSWPGESEPRSVVQVSRRTRSDFAAQSPHQKIDKVLEWVRGR